MGFLFGALAALSGSIQNSFFKGSKGADPFAVNWIRFLIAVPLLALAVTLFSHWIFPPRIFWFYLFCASLPLELLLAYFYVKAFQCSPQSKVGPLFSLSALFFAPLGFVFLAERPSALGCLGIASVALGPFFLGWEKGESGAAGLRHFFQERGTWYMLIATLCASMAVIVGKFSFRYVPPIEFAFWGAAALLLAHTGILFYKGISPRHLMNKYFLGLGALSGIGQIFHYAGLSLLFAAYFISLKRLSIVFDVFLGRLIYKEEYFKERLIGAFCMVAGVILIALG